MFGFKKKEAFKIVSPATGTLIPLTEVNDEVFSSKMMGDGFAIQPEKGTILAPISGIAKSVFPTGHAVGIATRDGIECIIHIGMDTVELNGEGFTPLISQGQKVNAGDPIVEVDLDKVRSKGYDPTTMVVFPSGYDHAFAPETKAVSSGEVIIES